MCTALSALQRSRVDPQESPKPDTAPTSSPNPPTPAAVVKQPSSTKPACTPIATPQSSPSIVANPQAKQQVDIIHYYTSGRMTTSELVGHLQQRDPKDTMTLNLLYELFYRCALAAATLAMPTLERICKVDAAAQKLYRSAARTWRPTFAQAATESRINSLFSGVAQQIMADGAKLLKHVSRPSSVRRSDKVQRTVACH